MGHSGAQARSAQGAGLLSIGQVLAKLTPDFPDLSPSKLRFLEERGLVSPARTPSGYRKFSGDDIERLRLILGMQRDHYLPLKVIRGYLDDIDAGKSPQLPGVSPGTASMLTATRRYKRAELITEAGASPTLLHDAISAGVLPPGESYDDDALGVLSALAELQRSGIEPRHLRVFRSAAERELGLIESALLPVSKRQDASSKARAAELAHDIARSLEVIRSSIIRLALKRLTS